MSLADDPGFALLRERLAGHPLPPLDMYKDRCLRRRLAVRMRACGARTLTEYAAVLDRTPDEVARLLATLTINVTQFFRNPSAWERLTTELEASTPSGLTAWCAGCATGEEPYTLAMLLADREERRGPRARPGGVRIDATDVDVRCLDAARAAVYATASFAEAPRRLVQRWTIDEGDRRRMSETVRALVRVLRHDLGRDPPPEPPYDLVVCRNVVIYFERDAQERLFSLFADALRPGGLLLLGKVEMLYGPARARFAIVDGPERLYRRAA
jgi:chemotaxis methyl-accepting protein methylase